MKKFTSGEIYRTFLGSDKKTIIRRTNLRYFSRKHNVDHTVCQGLWLVDFDDFLEKVNPKNINKVESLPRLRTKISAQHEWNATHRTKIKHYIIDLACESGNVFVYKHGRKNIINYDELEQEIIRRLKDKGKY